MTSLAMSGAFMALLGVFLAGLLAIANRRLYVYEDPRIGEVENMLPKNNCGACGQPGCRLFAEKVVVGEVIVAQCTSSNPAQRDMIASYLGVDAGSVEKRVARLACAGGDHVAFTRAHYAGLESCRAASVVSGGGKECPWGCLGLGDCAIVCTFNSITMDQHGLPVVDVETCTACGDCVEVCPKSLFSLHPVSHKLWVACMNRSEGYIAEAACEVACNACGRCAVDAPGAIKIDKNLAVIDYEKNDLAAMSAIERCPTGAIVWFDKPDRAVKGAAAKKIVRKQSLPMH
jgi:Na+-translocating ferredoxin:NAD+ oxidoreductase subunit B